MEGVKKVYNDIPKSPRDDRLYRGLELNNHMKVLVISDPVTDKAAAAMDVHIGKIVMFLLKFKTTSSLRGKHTCCEKLHHLVYKFTYFHMKV